MRVCVYSQLSVFMCVHVCACPVECVCTCSCVCVCARARAWASLAREHTARKKTRFGSFSDLSPFPDTHGMCTPWTCANALERHCAHTCMNERIRFARTRTHAHTHKHTHTHACSGKKHRSVHLPSLQTHLSQTEPDVRPCGACDDPRSADAPSHQTTG